ncbi:MAG: YhcH/YjgK/YiaL family protein [Sphaerochaetaceae bacterium]|nr:YhcH/YjgK/YiaL family protein [Sphaerochaetaceae bacterium]
MIFDILGKLEMYIPSLPKLRAVIDAMDHDDVYDREKGSYTTPDPDVTYEITTYTPSSSDKPFVFHKKHTTVEIVLSGTELLSTTWRELKNEALAYDSKTDTGVFTAEPISVFQGTQGRFAIFFSGEPYKSGVSDGSTAPVKKITFTIVD